MTCAVAASGSMAVFFSDVAKYSCEEVHTVTGMLSGSPEVSDYPKRCSS